MALSLPRSACAPSEVSQARFLTCSFFRLLLVGVAVDKIYENMQDRGPGQPCVQALSCGRIWACARVAACALPLNDARSVVEKMKKIDKG